MIVRLISPFATTYSKLSLQNKWWHRLSIVGLVFCVVAAFALSLALTLGPDIQSHKAAAPAKGEHGPWEQYAQITNLPPLPKGYSAVVMLSGQGERIQFPADTTKSELIKALCEHLKQGDAACWEVVSETPAASPATAPVVLQPDEISEAPAAGNGSSPEAPPALWRSIARDIGIALAVSLGLNYLLQLAYRALIFVMFGTATNVDSI
jgi:hypothetical protein